jgi:hypothetical protein
MVNSVARRPNSQNLLTQLITNNQIIKEVQSLDPVIVRKVIHHVGLEDSAEFLMLITSEQMQEVMDQDTWMSARPGEDEKLDAKRFCTWIEVLLEVGADFAAEKVAEMDEELLTLVLSQLIMAIDSDELALMTRSAEDDRRSQNRYLEKALESTFTQEVEGYDVMSKDSFHWDAVVNILAALGKNHRDLVERILSRISAVTMDQIDEFDGLYNLLKESDMLESDVSGDRQERREQEGFVTPSSASAFLKLILQDSLVSIIESNEQDHISKMYFRRFKPGKVKVQNPLSAELLEILQVHGLDISVPAMKLLGSTKAPSTTQKYLGILREENETLFQQKLTELNFISNVLLSGFTDRTRALRPVEAMELAIEVCDEGLNYGKINGLELDQSNLIKLFKVGWKIRSD